MTNETESKFQRLFTSSGVVFAGLVLQLGLGFLARIVIARLLGRVDYGAVALGVTLLNTAAIIVVIGTDTGVGRFLPRCDDTERRRGVLVSAYQLIMPLSVVIGFAVALLAGPIAEHAFHSPSLAPILRVFALTIPLAAFVRLTVGSVRGMKQSVPRVYIQNVGLPLSRFALIAVALLVGYRAVGVAWAYAGAYVVATLLSLYYLHRHTTLFSRKPAASMHRELLTFSAPIVVTTTMNTLFQNIDIFMLGYFASTGDVGIYTVVYPLASLLTTMLMAFGFVFMPTISELDASGNVAEMKRTYGLTSKWTFMTTLPLFLFVASFPELIIQYTFGSEFTPGTIALTVLAIGFFTQGAIGPCGDTLTAMGKTRLVMCDSVAVAVVIVLLNLVLIPRYSYVGAAAATTAGFLLMNTLYLVQLYREIGAHPFRGPLLRPGVIAGLLWAVLYLVVQTFFAVTVPVLAVGMVCFLTLYSVIIIRFGGIESEEVSLLGTFEERIGFELSSVRAVAKRFIG